MTRSQVPSKEVEQRPVTGGRRDPDDASVSRRRVLGLLVGTGSVLTFGCASSTNDSADNADGEADAGGDAASASPSDGATSDGATCTPTPEGEIGPYFADDSASGFNRGDILANIDGSSAQAGIPLSVTIFVVDGQNSCAPYPNAQVDIWHCNSAGVYSDQASQSTSTETWLRGYQLTDANGKVTFNTIIPGWYMGRTTHIHLRVRSSYSDASSTSDGTNTTQLFFAQTFVDRLATGVAPYNTEGQNPTTNASDRVYSQQENGANLLALAGDDTTGYSAAVTIVLPITSNGSGTNGPGTGGPGGGPPAGPPGPDGGTD